jgi:peptidoglycan/LPS O-acetylase OafA/YrhL
VPIFFALSGFLITSLLVTEKGQSGTISLRDFYIRRSLRIWPLYYLVLLIQIGIHFGQTHHWDWPMVAGWAFFYGNWMLTMRGGFSSIFWSLCVEEQFYLVWPWINRTLNLKTVAVLSCLCFVLAAAFRVFAAANHWPWQVIWYSTFAHIDTLGLGALLAISVSRLPRCTWGSAGIWSLIVVALGSMVGVSWIEPLLSRSGTISIGGAVVQSVVALASATILWALVTKAPEVKVLEHPTTVWLGKITFGLYLIHMTSLMLGRLIQTRIFHGSPLGLVVGPSVALAITVAIAGLSFRYYESWFLKQKKRFERVK